QIYPPQFLFVNNWLTDYCDSSTRFLFRSPGIFLLMFFLTTSFSLSGQSFSNPDFETSAICDPEACNGCEEVQGCIVTDIACIDGWWGYDNPAEGPLSAWYPYACWYPWPELLQFCDLGSRGIVLQEGVFQGMYYFPPNVSNRAATVNPIFQDNPNAIYQISFTLFPIDAEEE